MAIEWGQVVVQHTPSEGLESASIFVFKEVRGQIVSESGQNLFKIKCAQSPQNKNETPLAAAFNTREREQECEMLSLQEGRNEEKKHINKKKSEGTSNSARTHTQKKKPGL